MCYEEVACPRCSALNVKKRGITANNKQRFRCSACNRQFITDYTYQACNPAVRALVLPMTLTASGMRDISRVGQVSTNTVRNLIRPAAQGTAEPVAPQRSADLELDEFWSFVPQKKHQRWTWLAFDRARRPVRAVVKGSRSDKSCARLLTKLMTRRGTRFPPDKWASYLKLLPAPRPLLGTEGRRHIEGHHLNFRTPLKR